jgi:O-antigen ligase
MIWVLIGYMFLFIHRPFEVWPSLAEIHLERVYMVGALLYAATSFRWIPNRQHMAYFVFAAVVMVCWFCSPWMEQGEETVENFLKILVFYVLIVAVIHDEKSLRLLLLGFLGVMTVYMLHSLREYVGGRYVFRMGFARMIGVDKAMGDPNTFGASIVYALPFVVPFWKCSRPSEWSKVPDIANDHSQVTNPTLSWMRCFLIGYVCLSVVCIGLTGSRSAFVGLLLWGSIMLIRSRWRWAMGIVALGCIPVLWGALPEALQTRFETIVNPEVGPANAQESAHNRLEGLEIGFKLWSQYPATGCGPGAWKPATGRKIESHNLYGQIVGETGALGLLAFTAIVLGFSLNLYHVRRRYREHPEWGRDFLFHVTGSIGFALFLLLFEGNFGHNLFRYSWLWYGGFLIITRHCVEERLQELPSTVPIHQLGFVGSAEG